MTALRHLAAELDRLGAAGLLRQPQDEPLSADVLVLCSNDYLGYCRQPLVLPDGASGGAGASRLVSGDHREHRRLERALCDWLGYEAGLLFSSGYAANVGTLSALATAEDIIVSDALNHASIVDGCRLSRAKVIVVPHLDAAAAEHALDQARAERPSGRRWLVTESYFSMNGTIPDLPRLRRACHAHKAALVVDEAHALGVFGPAGRGLCSAMGIEADVLVGTLGKAVGLQGAFVLGCPSLRRWLWNHARSAVFSTAISPALAAAGCSRVAEVASDDQGRARLHELSAWLRAELAGRGTPIRVSRGPIVPWAVESPQQALRLSAQLLERGVFVQAIRPPTVPHGTALLRLTVSGALTKAQLLRAVDTLEEVWRAGQAGDPP